jgi:hypothetical protein
VSSAGIVVVCILVIILVGSLLLVDVTDVAMRAHAELLEHVATEKRAAKWLAEARSGAAAAAGGGDGGGVVADDAESLPVTVRVDLSNGSTGLDGGGGGGGGGSGGATGLAAALPLQQGSSVAPSDAGNVEVAVVVPPPAAAPAAVAATATVPEGVEAEAVEEHK